MRQLIAIGALAWLVAAPAYAAASDTEVMKSTPQGMMMNCPMMGNASAMQKDLGTVMGDVEIMMKAAKNGAQKEHLMQMHERMAVLMAKMQTMGGGMMGGQQSATATPANPQAAPAKEPDSPEDHTAHHPTQ